MEELTAKQSLMTFSKKRKEMFNIVNKMIEDYRFNRYKSSFYADMAMDYLNKFADAMQANDIEKARKYLEKASHAWHMAG